jgi:hypothetical protein
MLNWAILRICGFLVATGAALAAPTGPDCDGPYYWADGFRICLNQPANDWAAIAFRRPPETADIDALQGRLRAFDIKLRTASRPFTRYGLVLLKKPELSPRYSGNLLSILSQGAGQPLELLQVFRVNRSLLVLVNNFTVQFRATAEEPDAIALLERHGAIVEKRLPAAGGFVIRFPQYAAHQGLQVVNSLQQNPLVQYAKPNFEVFMPRPDPRVATAPRTSRPACVATPGAPGGSGSRDPCFPEQWYLNNSASVSPSRADINAVRAWSITTGSPAVVVAILDDGVEPTHEDLPKLHRGYDAVDGDDDPWPERDNADHGTACAGIIAAVAGNGIGIKGVAPGVSVMPIRIDEPDDFGNWSFNADIYATGIWAAVDGGAHVLSASWGFPYRDSDVTAAIDYALRNNRVVVFAAGNDGREPVDYPASLAETRPVIAVGATDDRDQVVKKDAGKAQYWGSNFGHATTLVAPGVQIFTTDLMGSRGSSPDNYYPDFGGTSAATPMVAAAAALILSEDPTLTPAQVRERLISSAERFTSAGKPKSTSTRNKFYGWGRLDACRAVSGSSTRCTR